MRELDLRDITLVMQDWGGLIGGGFALHHAERVKAALFPEYNGAAWPADRAAAVSQELRNAVVSVGQTGGG